MKTFKEFLKEANLVGRDSPFSNMSFRVDPRGTGQFEGPEKSYGIGQGKGTLGSWSLGNKPRMPGTMGAVNPNLNKRGVMTTENPKQLANYMFPRGTNIITHVDPETGQHHISVTANSPEHEEEMRNSQYTITGIRSKDTEEMPKGFPGERIMRKGNYNEKRPNALKQHVDAPVDFIQKNLGIKVTFRSPEEQENHKNGLKQDNVDFSEEG